MVRFNLLCNKKDYVFMSATDGLSDLAFEKGWRIALPAITYRQMNEYHHSFIPFMTEAQFYLEYLQDEVMPEEEAVFLAGLCTVYYEDNDQLNPDELDDADGAMFESNFITPDIGEESTL